MCGHWPCIGVCLSIALYICPDACVVRLLCACVHTRILHREREREGKKFHCIRRFEIKYFKNKMKEKKNGEENEKKKRERTTVFYSTIYIFHIHTTHAITIIHIGFCLFNV